MRAGRGRSRRRRAPAPAEEQLGGPLPEHVEDDLDGRDARVLDRLQGLLDLLDADPVRARRSPSATSRSQASNTDGVVVDLPRWAVELDEVDVSTPRFSRERSSQPRKVVVRVDARRRAARGGRTSSPRRAARAARAGAGRPAARSGRRRTRRRCRRTSRPRRPRRAAPPATRSSSVAPQSPPIAQAPKPISETR